MATTSNYPGAIDTLQTPGASLAGPPTHNDIHLEIADAVEKLETELGVNGRHRTFRSYADTTARTAGNGSPLAGHCAFMEDVDRPVWYTGSAWSDPVDEWRPRVAKISETSLTDSWTATAASWTAFGSAQTYTKPAGWTSYDLHISGHCRLQLSPQIQFYAGCRLVEGGVTQTQASYLVIDNWRTGSTTNVQVPLVDDVFTGLTANASLRPEVWLGQIAGTSPQIDAVRWDIVVTAHRVS